MWNHVLIDRVKYGNIYRISLIPKFIKDAVINKKSIIYTTLLREYPICKSNYIFKFLSYNKSINCFIKFLREIGNEINGRWYYSHKNKIIFSNAANKLKNMPITLEISKLMEYFNFPKLYNARIKFSLFNTKYCYGFKNIHIICS